MHAEIATLDSVCKEVDHGEVVCLVEPHNAMGYVVLLLVGSLGMPRLTVGMICVLSFLMYLNRCQYHQSEKSRTGLNYCQVIPHQINENIGCHH